MRACDGCCLFEYIRLIWIHILAQISKVKSKAGVAVRETSPHRYGKSHAIWDHTVLPATRKEYLSRVTARVETDAEKWNVGQMCQALVCRRTEPAESSMPLISTVCV